MAGIYNLDQLRSTAPKNLQGVSDEQLVLEYSKSTGQDPFYVAELLGVQTGQNKGDFAAGVGAGIDTVQSLGISAAAGLADAVGAEGASESLRKAAEAQQYEAYFAGKPNLERVEDLEGFGDYIDYAQYQLGKQIPIMGTVAAAQAVPGLGQAASATGLARLGALAPRAMGGGGLTGSTLARMGPLTAAEMAGVRQGAGLAKSVMVGTGLGYGSLYEASGADGDPNPYAALALSPLYGVAEAAVPAALTGAIRLKGGGFTGNALDRAIKGFATSGATEAATELTQTGMEIALDGTQSPEEIQSALLNAAVAGAIVGGTVGAAGGAIQKKIQVNEVGEKDLAPVTPTSTSAPVEQMELDVGAPMTTAYEQLDEAGVPYRGYTPAEETQQEMDLEPEAIADEAQGAFDFEEGPQREYATAQNAILREGAGFSRAKRRAFVAEAQKLEDQADRVGSKRPKKIKGQSEKARKAAEAKLEEQRAQLRERASKLREKVSVIDRVSEASNNLKLLQSANRKIEKDEVGMPIVNRELTEAEMQVLSVADPMLYENIQTVAQRKVEATTAEQEKDLAQSTPEVVVEAATQVEPQAEAAATPVTTEADTQVDTQVETQVDTTEDTLLDAEEYAEMESRIEAMNKLSAEVQATEGQAQGRVTLPTNAVAGIVRMLRDPSNLPVGVIYEKGTMKPDAAATEQYLPQMRAIHEAAKKVIDKAQAASNAAKQVDKGITEETELKDSSSKNRKEKYAKRRNELAVAVDQFISTAGGAKNAEAIIAAMKVRNEKNRSAVNRPKRFAQANKRLRKKGSPLTNQREYEQLNDLLLSSSFLEYKNGTLGDLDVIRGSQTRTNLYERKIGVTQPLEAAAAKKGILGILDVVASKKGTTSGYAKSLGQYITKVFNSLKEGDVGVNVVFIEDTDGAEVTPNYNPNNNTIYIHRTASQEEILHESLHAALQWYVYQNSDSPYVTGISESIDQLFGFVASDGFANLNMPLAHKEKALEVVNLLRQLRESGNELDAVLEMISYGTTMRDFKDLLKSITAEPSEAVATWRENLESVWQRIVDIFKWFLGVENTVANNVLDNTLAMLDNAIWDQRDPKIGGNRLDMSILSSDFTDDMVPVDADSKPLGDLYKSARGKQGMDKYLTTQVLFDAVGLTEERYAAQKAKFDEKLDKFAKHIRENMPRLERTITYFNSRFSVPPAMRGIFDIYKEQRNSVYMVLERLAMYVESQSPENIAALMDYLNGNDTALDNVPNSARLKNEADIVLSGIQVYAELLPDDLRKSFEENVFTDFLLEVSGEKSVASHTIGMAKLSEQIKNQGVAFDATDIDTNRELFDSDENGDLILTGEFYEVVIKPATGKPYTLMVSKDKHDRLGGKLPIGEGPYKVDTGRTWLMAGATANKYRFKSKLNYKQAMDRQKAKELANAMRNTVGGLSNFFASKNFFAALADQGAVHQVMFDNEAAVNEAFGTDLGNTQKVFEPGKQDSLLTREATRRSGTWVKIPDNPDMYGEAANKILHGPVWHAMQDMSSRKPLVDSEAYNGALRYFKKSKTIYNLGTHVTNVASNVTLAMLHDIPLNTIYDAAKLMYKYEVNSDSLNEQELSVMRAFMGSGAMLGNYSSVEVKKAMYESMAKHFTPAEDNVMNRVTAFFKMEADKGERISQLAARAKDKALKLDEYATELYAAEDNIFRLAAFIKAAGDSADKAGVTSPTDDMLLEAGRFARQAFLDYDIDAPAVKFLRQSFMPFVSWTYAVTPVLGRIIANQPWKVANVLAAYYLIDLATASLAGDDDELRKLGPERLDERMFGFGPRMYIRIPFAGDDQNPVYYRLGDYIPLASTAKGLPNGFAGQDWWPGGLTPGGPFINAIIGIVGGTDPYTGDPIHQPTDGNADKLMNVAKFGYDLFAPPMVRSSNYEKVTDAIDGKVGVTGREIGISNLIFSKIMGLKAFDYNVDEEAAFRDIRQSQIVRDYKAAISKAKREELRRGYPDYESLNAEIESLTAEMYEEYNKIYKIDEE